MPEDNYMHLFYTLIASGLMILAEIPAEQPPPPLTVQNVVYIASTQAPTAYFSAFNDCD